MAKRTRKPSVPAGRPRASTATDAPAAPAAQAPEPKLVSVGTPRLAAPELKKRELIDLVVARSEIRKKFAKPVVEAMLAVLGETLAEGREMNLPPLGKLRINRAEDKGTARIIICKLRQPLDAAPPAGGGEPADAADAAVAADAGAGPDPAD